MASRGRKSLLYFLRSNARLKVPHWPPASTTWGFVKCFVRPNIQKCQDKVYLWHSRESVGQLLSCVSNKSNIKSAASLFPTHGTTSNSKSDQTELWLVHWKHRFFKLQVPNPCNLCKRMFSWVRFQTLIYSVFFRAKGQKKSPTHSRPKQHRDFFLKRDKWKNYIKNLEEKNEWGKADSLVLMARCLQRRAHAERKEVKKYLATSRKGSKGCWWSVV